MICNKKAHPDMREQCKNCGHYTDCVVNGKKVAVAVAELLKLAEGGICNEAMLCGTADCVQPILIPHDYRDVKIAEGMTVTIDLEELKTQLERDFYRQAGLGLQFGA